MSDPDESDIAGPLNDVKPEASRRFQIRAFVSGRVNANVDLDRLDDALDIAEGPWRR